MASGKIYAVFHVFGCFKFKVTFHNGIVEMGFDIDINLKWFCGISKPNKIYNHHFWQQNMLSWVLLKTV